MQQNHYATRRFSGRGRPLRGAAVLAGAVLLLAVAACSDGDDSGLPAATSSTATSSAPTTSGSPSGPSADEQAAMQAVNRYNATIDGIAGGKKLDTAKVHQVATEPLATRQITNLAQVKSAGMKVVGFGAYHLRSVSVQGNSATVKQCVDSSKTVLIKPGAATPTTRSNGLKVALAVSTLTKKDGAWLLSNRRQGATCSLK